MLRRIGFIALIVGKTWSIEVDENVFSTEMNNAFQEAQRIDSSSIATEKNSNLYWWVYGFNMGILAGLKAFEASKVVENHQCVTITHLNN